MSAPARNVHIAHNARSVPSGRTVHNAHNCIHCTQLCALLALCTGVNNGRMGTLRATVRTGNSERPAHGNRMLGAGLTGGIIANPTVNAG